VLLNEIDRNNNNNNTLIYIAPACRMTSEALHGRLMDIFIAILSTTVVAKHKPISSITRYIISISIPIYTTSKKNNLL